MRARGQRTRSYRAAVERWLGLPWREQQVATAARVHDLLVHAQQTVPHYREAFRRVGFDARTFDRLEHLRDVPELAHIEFRERTADLHSDRFDPAHLVRYRTGGTTGAPVAFSQTRRSIWCKEALTEALHARMGWRPGQRVAWLWGAAQDAPAEGRDALRRLKRRLEAWVDAGDWYAASTLDEARIDDYIRRLQARPPAAMQAYPSAADLMAKRLLATGQRLPIPLVLLSAEQVYDDQRARVAQAFDAEVFTFYGARELGWVAAEQRGCHRLHVGTACMHVESTVDHRLLVTDLVNWAMPLIRYEIGDRGVVSTTPCPCGDPRPVIEALEGRIADAFTLPSGKLVSAALLDTRNRQLRREGVLEAQLVQDAPGHLTIGYVPGTNYADGFLDELVATLTELTGGELEIAATRIDNLATEPNGKVRWCVGWSANGTSSS